MVFDVGGLRYPIIVEDKFSPQTKQFREEIQASRDAIQQFRADIESLVGFTSGLKKELTQIKLTVRQVSAANRDSTEATNKASSAADIRSAAEKKLARDLKNSRVAIEARRVADEQGFNIYKRLAKGATLRQQAEAELAQLIQKRAKDQIKLQLAEAQGVELTKKKAVALTTEEKAQRKLALIEENRAVNARLQQLLAEKGIELSKKKTAALSAQAEAENRIARAERKREIVSILREKGIGPSGDALPRELTATERAAQRVTSKIRSLQDELEFKRLASGNLELRKLQRELGEIDGRANRVSFTFRRLFGILAAFAAARALLSFFRQAVVEAVKFNSSLEQSTLGIATLLTAVGDVRDATGGATTASHKLALANAAAKDQVAQLRLEALRTAATFDALVETFQVALAPGLESGLDVNQVRKFTVQISQAAAALGIAQNQLSEEIRSILSGTIQQRTTRIATALGITNEDIRRAKELGVLADFLNDRFQAFSEAGKDALNTLTVIASNTQDALLQVLGAGALGFFNELKGLLGDIQNSLTKISDDNIELNPEAVAVATAIFDGLKGAVAEARRLRQNLGFGDILGAARAVGTALEISARIVGALVEGFVRGLGTLQNVANAVSDTFRSLGSSVTAVLPVESFRELLVILVQIATTFGAVVLALNTTLFASRALLLPFQALITLAGLFGRGIKEALGFVSLIAKGFALVLTPVGLITVAIATVLLILGNIASEVFGVNIRFETLIKIVKVSLTAAFKFAAAIAKGAFLELFLGLRIGFRTVVQFITSSILGISEGILFLLDKVGVDVDELQKKINKLQSEGDESFVAKTREDIDAINKSTAEGNAALKEAANAFKEGFSKALDENETAKTFDESIAALAKSAKERFSGLFGGVDLGVDNLTNQVKPLGQVFADLPGVIGQSADNLQETSKIVQELGDSLAETRKEFELALELTRLTGAVQRQAQVVIESEVAKRKQLLEVEGAITQAKQKQVEIQTRQQNLERRFGLLRGFEQDLVSKGLEEGQAQLALTRQLAQARNESSILELAIQKALKDGDKERARTLQDQANSAAGLVDFLEESLTIQQQRSDSVFGSFEAASPEQTQRLKEIISDIIVAQGEQVANEDTLKQLAEKRAEVEQIINDIAEQRIGIIAAEEVRALKIQNAELEARKASELELGKIKDGFLEKLTNNIERQRIELNAQIILDKQKLEALKEQAKLEEEALETQIKQTEDTKVRLELEKQLAELKKKNAAEIDLQGAKIEQASANAITLEQAQQSPISSGIKQAALNLEKEYSNTFERVTAIAEDAILGLADTISGALIDAFDPGNEQTIVQRFAALAKAIADAVIKELIRIIVVRFIAGLVGGAAGGAAGAAGGATAGAAAGAAKGGKVGQGVSKRGAPSVYHAMPGVQAFNSGGKAIGPRAPRPAGLDHRDVVPVWTRVGEWMVRPEAARMYGDAFMSALNAGKIDPAAAQMLAGRKRINGLSQQVRRPGFATGGLVSERLARTPVAAQTPASQPAFTPALVVADEQSMDRMLAGGRSAMLSFLEDNSTTIKKILEIKQ